MDYCLLSISSCHFDIDGFKALLLKNYFFYQFPGLFQGILEFSQVSPLKVNIFLCTCKSWWAKCSLAEWWLALLLEEREGSLTWTSTFRLVGVLFLFIFSWVTFLPLHIVELVRQMYKCWLLSPIHQLYTWIAFLEMQTLLNILF